METTIKVNITGDTMNFIFDRGFINIRHFECENPNYEPTEKNNFDVKIRHNENEKPKDLFTSALIDCKNIMKLRKNKYKKVMQLQEKVKKITENLTTEIQSIC